MKKRLLVTGAGGFVAGSVITQAGSDWTVHAISRAARSAEAGDISWHTCDPLRGQELKDVFRAVRPDAVIHCAAIADIDVAEHNQDLARAVNVTFTKTLAELSAENGSRFVLCSTDNVFDGQHAPYNENDLPAPVNFYGHTKVEAEQSAKSLGERAVIARLAIVMGLPLLGSGNSFLARMLRTLSDGQQITVPAKEVRTPVDVITAGRALLELANGNQTGIFHLAGNERLNRLEMAQRIARFAGLNPTLIQPQGVATPERRAPRPRDVSLNNMRTRDLLKTPMLDFDEALRLIFQH